MNKNNYFSKNNFIYKVTKSEIRLLFSQILITWQTNKTLVQIQQILIWHVAQICLLGYLIILSYIIPTKWLMSLPMVEWHVTQTRLIMEISLLLNPWIYLSLTNPMDLQFLKLTESQKPILFLIGFWEQSFILLFFFFFFFNFWNSSFWFQSSQNQFPWTRHFSLGDLRDLIFTKIE